MFVIYSYNKSKKRLATKNIKKVQSYAAKKAHNGTIHNFFVFTENAEKKLSEYAKKQ